MRGRYRFNVGDNSTGQCSACMEVFYGENAFDSHRRGDGSDRHCVDPANPPLRKDGKPEQWWMDEKGRWHVGQRMDDEARARLQVSSARAGAEKTPSLVSQVPPTDSVPSTAAASEEQA